MNVLAFVVVCLVILSVLGSTFKKDPPPKPSKTPPRDNVAAVEKIVKDREQVNRGNG